MPENSNQIGIVRTLCQTLRKHNRNLSRVENLGNCLRPQDGRGSHNFIFIV